MSGIRDQKNIDDLRKRLYERDFLDKEEDRHELSASDVDVSRGWSDVAPRPVLTPQPEPVPSDNPASTEETNPGAVDYSVERPEVKKKRPYRLIILLASLAVFIVVAIISSIYLFFGTNQISTRNISIDLNAPTAVAAGEGVTLQISVSNQNTVKIESANLILNYPSGTKTSDEQARDLFEERIPVSDIGPGEAVNIPVDIILFGEENEEKEIKASIEYRVVGSNGTFFKDAEPIKITINSSPLVVRATSLSKVSSGQELELKITLQSNASAVQRNILVSADYPNSFSFISSDPEPAYGQNEWLIKEIAPDSSETITVRGLVNGEADERGEVQLTAGTPRSDNQFIMGSVLTKSTLDYTIERPFIDVSVDINGDKDGATVVDFDEDAEVSILVKNTLNESIYDMRVEVSPKGNVIRDNLVSVPTGFYDSNAQKITWEVSGEPNLSEVKPGDSREFTFKVKPDPNQQTASFDVSTKIFARRLNEPGATEEIVGTIVAEAKFESRIITRSQLGHGDGLFEDAGPIPPQANKTTTYTATLEVVAGANDATETVLTTTLPQYVTWLDNYDGPGTVEYNPSSKQIRWNIGTMDTKSSKKLQFQVGLLPSVTQVDRTPVVINNQQVRATDRFTGTTITAEAFQITSELSTEFGFSKGNGVVEE